MVRFFRKPGGATRLLALAAAAILSGAARPAPADTVRFTSGREMECVVLAESADHVTVRRGYGVMDIPQGMIAKIVRTPVIAAAGATPATRATDTATSGSAHRFPAWTAVVGLLARQPWATDFRQIPATYIDNGSMRDVPYQSFSCGGDYEVNVYGDPDDPACVEIGAYRGLLNDARARENCVELLARLLPNAADAAILRAMDRGRDKVERDGLTIEVTPPDAPDAYGGWWVSIYDEAKLGKARATRAELDQITTAATTPPTPRPAAPKPAAAPAPSDVGDDWTPDDLQRRRRAQAAAAAGTTASAGGQQPTYGGGRVYVHAYYRKDGTYVRAHTRSR